MRIIFCGTPNFAVPSLKSLIKNKNIDVCAVVTQPDRKTGRGQKNKPSPIKTVALKYRLPIFTKPINQIGLEIKEINPDLLIVCAYGYILNKKILNIPKFGCINIHASLLPKYRGPSPIQQAILNGDKETGITIIKMTEKLDAGPIISQEKIKINTNDTAGTLHNKLSILGSKLLIRTLKKYPFGSYELKKQNKDKAIYTKKIHTDDAKISPEKEEATKIEKKIRAYNPWPGAYIIAKNKRFKIFAVEIKKHPKKLKCKIYKNKFILYNSSPAIICKDKKILIIKEIQPEGKRRMSGREFVIGYLK